MSRTENYSRHRQEEMTEEWGEGGREDYKDHCNTDSSSQSEDSIYLAYDIEDAGGTSLPHCFYIDLDK